MPKFSISFTTVKSAVRRQLSIIGKHHAAPQGGSLFSTTDLTTIESTVMSTFIVASAQLIVSELSPVVSSYSATGDSLSFEITPSRWGTALPSSFSDSVQSFIIADTTQSVLNMTIPDIAPKYTADAKNLLAALATIAFTKQPPVQAKAEYASVFGKMCNDDGSDFSGS